MSNLSEQLQAKTAAFKAAMDDAKEMMAWVFYYIEEAQIAVLEALVARVKAEALKV